LFIVIEFVPVGFDRIEKSAADRAEQITDFASDIFDIRARLVGAVYQILGNIAENSAVGTAVAENRFGQRTSVVLQ
jgi:hypothetical protein